MAIADSDGTSLEARFLLAGAVRAGSSDATALWQQVSNGADSALPCDADPTRDAVFLGTLSVVSNKPSFSATLSLIFRQDDGLDISVGAVYSSDRSCEEISENNGMELASISPHLDGPTWGPVPVEIVVANYYSPASPNGNTSLLVPAALGVYAVKQFAGLIGYSSVRPATDVAGNEYQVLSTGGTVLRLDEINQKFTASPKTR